MENVTNILANIDPWLALGVAGAMAVTDAVCVMFTASVVHRKGLAVANWSALSYTLSGFAVISYTNHWIYIVFAAIGSWFGAYLAMKYLPDATAAPTVAGTAAVIDPTGKIIPAPSPQPLAASPLPSDERVAA
jgi:hypothetical protein